VLALDDLLAAPAGWEDTPIYAVNDLVDMVHKLAEAPATEAVPGTTT
jgi:hypothetical protein